MNKLLLFTSLALTSFFSNAQNYNLTTLDQPYTELNSGIILNNQAWFHNNYNIPLPFKIKIFGEEIKNLILSNGSLYANDLKNSDIEYQLFAESAELLDVGHLFLEDEHNNNSKNSFSPLRYQVDGPTGNRILKIEIANAANGNEYFEENTKKMRVTYQIWFYEQNHQIEYRYGKNTITDFNTFFDDGSIPGKKTPSFNVIIAKIKIIPSEDPKKPDTLIPQQVISLKGNSNSPVLEDSIEVIQRLNDYPKEGKVYQFSSSTLSIDTNAKSKVNLYPNPATNTINLHLEEADNSLEYQIFDISGKLVLSGKTDVTTSIDIAKINSGVYFLKVGRYKTEKFIKK